MWLVWRKNNWNEANCYFRGKELEEVLSYNYLGGVLEGCLRKVPHNMWWKVELFVEQWLPRVSNRSFQVVLIVFKSSLLGTLLYASPIVFLLYINQLVWAQNYFFKSYVSLKFNSPNYVVMGEFYLPLIVTILKQTLRFTNKVRSFLWKNAFRLYLILSPSKMIV